MIELSGSALKRAQLVPSAVFPGPEAVVRATGLSRAQKLQILRRWEFDVRRSRPVMGRGCEALEDGGGAEFEAMLLELQEAIAALGGNGRVSGAEAAPLASPVAPIVRRARTGACGQLPLSPRDAEPATPGARPRVAVPQATS